MEKKLLKKSETQTFLFFIISCKHGKQKFLKSIVKRLNNFTIFSCWKFELGKICSKLKTRAKILINQPNASIFSGCVPLRKTMLSQTFSYAHTRFGAIFFKISKLFKDFQRFSFHIC